MAALVKFRSEKRAMRRAGEAGRRVEYLAFVLAGETYAVPIGDVAEILRPLPVTEVPRAPATVLGVVSVRGKLVTVIRVAAEASSKQIEAAALSDAKVQSRIAGRTLVKVIVVPGKLVNLVVKL